MPRKQPLGSEWEVEMTGAVEHHFNHSLNHTISRLESADVETETPGNRGSHLLGVEFFPFDLAALEHVLLLQLETESFQAPNQPSLQVAHRGQTRADYLVVPAEARPSRKLVN